MCSGDLFSIERLKFSVDHFSISFCSQNLELQGVSQTFYLCLFIFYFLEMLKLFLKNRIVYLEGIWARALYHKISKCYICMTYYDGHQIPPEPSLIYLYICAPLDFQACGLPSKHPRGWSNDLAVKSTFCSSREPKFRSQNTHQVAPKNL